MEISTRTPRLQITGVYKGEGGIGYLPLEGQGAFNVSMVDVTSAWMVYYREVALPSSPPEAMPEDADEASLGMEVETFALDVMPAKVSYYFDRFLDGDNGLGEAPEVKGSSDGN
ncbi:hypothetical protein J437_LFUL007991 [Ladona fulva]|uniref:Uncharacterized protein n=1 Tax=Ladona fulva TaxID=123851 RepID=A0A8K0K3L7_LADFU|nr:hypothetical protein J437_LFUL007991 [Ladona fulva]